MTIFAPELDRGVPFFRCKCSHALKERARVLASGMRLKFVQSILEPSFTGQTTSLAEVFTRLLELCIMSPGRPDGPTSTGGRLSPVSVVLPHNLDTCTHGRCLPGVRAGMILPWLEGGAGPPPEVHYSALLWTGNQAEALQPVDRPVWVAG